MSRPLIARIHLRALARNLAVARRLAPTCRIVAVLKANAYGHGVLHAAAALGESDAFAVIELEAAVRLREAGCARDILLLEGVFGQDELAFASQHGLSLVVHHEPQLAMLERVRIQRRFRVFLEINTGLNRLGFPLRQVSVALARLRTCVRCPKSCS